MTIAPIHKLLLFLTIFLVLPIICFADSSTLPDNLTVIASEAFAGTTAFKHVTLPEGVLVIADRAFADSALQSITLPESLVFISESAFDGCNIVTAYVIKDSYAETFCIEQSIPYTTNSMGADSTVELTVISPWSAGGSSDAILRAFILNDSFASVMNRTASINYQTGGGGYIGHQALSNATPDGHTLGLVTFELSKYSHLGISSLSHQNLDPICRISTQAAAILVNTSWATANHINNLHDFILYCEQYPHTVQMGCSASAGVWHIAGGYLMYNTGISLQMVPYQTGVADAVYSAASGYIQGAILPLSEAQHYLNAKQLTCLGVMDNKRDPSFPEIPTCSESGYSLNFCSYHGIALPKGVNSEIRNLISSACNAAIADDTFVSFMNDHDYAISYQDSETFASFLEQNYSDVGKALSILGY